MPSTAIVLFARSPEREAAAKRMPQAAPLFRAVIAAWLDAAERHGAEAVIACAEEDRAAIARIAPHLDRRWIEQGAGSFGERVIAAARTAFASFDSVLIAAIDAPPPRELGAAIDALARGVTVIGPARDGGVNFIGLRSFDAELLARLTVARCRALCPNLLVLRAVTDLDSQRSLAAAHNERAWLTLFDALVFHHATISGPHVAAERVLPPRAPPAP
jgi:glycosyltransferase A (GT-A) superfamily protein (DUF2064 family)